MIFVNSMSDLFQEGVPADFIVRVWDVMAEAHWHIFQILTKRPDNMARILQERQLPILENVWLGTSVENGKYLNRIDRLREAPAAVRFISFEPLIGSVKGADLSEIDWAIVGGESGPGARPMDIGWVDEIKLSCDNSDTAFFFKQWGGVNKKKAGRIYQGQTWDEMPVMLRAV